MWFSVLTLIVLANLHDDVKSNPLPVAVKGYVYTPNIGYHRIHHQATTFHLTEPVRKEGEDDLAIINSEEGLNNFIVANRPWQNDQEFRAVERRRRQSASATLNTSHTSSLLSASGPGAKVEVTASEKGNGVLCVTAIATTNDARATNGATNTINLNSAIHINTGKYQRPKLG